MPVSAMVLSGDSRIDGLLFGLLKWSGNQITYSLATTSSVWGSEYTTDTTQWNSFPYQPLYAVPSLAQAPNIRAAMAAWSSLIATPIVEVADNASGAGDMRVAFSIDPNRPTASFGIYPGETAGGDIWLGNSSNFQSDYPVGSGYYRALMHEIGHALGLKHPFDQGFSTILDAAHSTLVYSVMAYEYVVGHPSYYAYFNNTTPMVYDILAIQYLYGKNTTTNAGDNIYQFSDQGQYHQTVYDPGGTNTFKYTGVKPVVIDLRAGNGSTFGQENWIIDTQTSTKIQQIPNVWIAYDTVIANVTSEDGNDTIVGNDVANSISTG